MRWIWGILVVVLTMTTVTVQAEYAAAYPVNSIAVTTVSVFQANAPCNDCHERLVCVSTGCDLSGITSSTVRRMAASGSGIDPLLLRSIMGAGFETVPTLPPPKG